MSKSRKFTILGRFAFVSVLLEAFYWACYYLINTNIPLARSSSIPIFSGLQVSRAWDVLAMPVLVVILVFLLLRIDDVAEWASSFDTRSVVRLCVWAVILVTSVMGAFGILYGGVFFALEAMLFFGKMTSLLIGVFVILLRFGFSWLIAKDKT